MAAKYQLITELYRRTGVAVAKNPQAWQGFLSSACRNYKCRFDEQLLIYAQRPDAVAVAKLETWNRQFKRWVNKDSKGIAVFDPKGRRNTLKYYFDVSDTHEGYYGSRPVPIWQMDERYEQAVMERLSDRFGDVESTDLASALMETAKNAVEDNLQDYFSQLKDCTKDSFLEELDDFNIEVVYRRLAANSVAFMLISRCGLDTNEFFDRDDFADIVNFNTPATINAIGIATSDIAEMALREISQSIRNVQMAEKDQNRTFAQRTQAQYDKDSQQPERSEYNEQNHLQQTGGLSYSRPNITDRARASAWQVRFDAQGLSGEAQESDLSQPADIGQAERASARGRADSTPEVGASDEAALSRAGRDRGTERESTDAVGRTDEQHPQSSGGSDTDRTDLQVSVAKEDEVRVNLPTVDEQIEMIAKAEDEKASAFAISKEDIDSVLQKGSGVADGKYRIYRQFQKGVDRQKNIEFLKNEYGTGGGTHIFPDGFSGHSWHDSKGLAIDRNGTYTNHDLVLKWSQVEKRLRELIKDNRYLNPKEKDHYADYLESVSAPQYEIDTQRKIARQRFIDAHRDLPPADKRDTLALRLSDFIRDLDRYEKDLLSAVERSDLADVTAEQMEQHLSDPSTVQQLIDFLAQVQWKTTSVFSRSNGWKFTEELRELHPLRYLYNEGDVVYIGADKYEIATLTEEKVYLQNAEFPILGQEYSRADFEEKLTENHANDHLKVVVTEKQRTETPSEKKQDGIQFSIGFSEHPAFYDRQFNDRYTDLSFALGNKLLGILDEKQHREREGDKNIGWYHKTDFVIKAVIGGEEFNYEGRFDIGDGEGDLIAHIKNFYDYALSPKGEQLYGDDRESLLRGRGEFIPFLEQHTELTKEDEKLLDEIMATESDWYRTAEEAKEKPQAYADIMNGSEAPAIEMEKSADDLIGREIIIDNRKYLIENIGKISGDVSLRDITFQNNVGFPINRVEKIGYIQKLLEQEKTELPPEEKTEAPAVDRHNFRINDDAIGVGGAKEKFRNNMAAINLLHELEIENRLATPEEQEVLSRYVGWGGLSMAFDEHNTAWAEEFKELYASLSPKGEIVRDIGGLLENKGYEVRVLDLINMHRSHCYNPFVYLRNDNDVQRLVTNLFKATTPKGSQSQDPFWDTAASMLLLALVFYLKYEAPPDEQNFPMVMELLRAGEVREDDDSYVSPLDELFDRLEMVNPEHIALKYYRDYHSGSAKTLKSIQITLAARLEKFNLESLAGLTATDELDLPSLGEKKVALFALIPDNDTSFNFLVSILYTQLFQQLFYLADHKYGGSLPVHCHFIMDEFANVSLPDDFDKILSVMRSRGVSVSIILQNLAQLKALFEKQWESIVGNCDEFLYLGGNEQSTHKYVSELLGKETIDTNTHGKSSGRSGNYSTNYQISGRELMTPDEVRMLDNRYALLFVRGERPVMDFKYDILKHPNVKLTADGGQPPYIHGEPTQAVATLVFDSDIPDNAVSVKAVSTSYELLSDEDLEEIFNL